MEAIKFFRYFHEYIETRKTWNSSQQYQILSIIKLFDFTFGERKRPGPFQHGPESLAGALEALGHLEHEFPILHAVLVAKAAKTRSRLELLLPRGR